MTEHVGNRYSVPKQEIFPPELNTRLERNKDLFSNLGSGIRGFTGTLTLDVPDVKPVFKNIALCLSHLFHMLKRSMTSL